MTRAGLFEFLAAQKLGVLGTLTSDGSPQSALVGIAVTDRFEIIFDTLQDTRKYRNLKFNAAASLVTGWDAEITVQYEGEARELSAAERAIYLPIYLARWPECRSHLDWPGITHFVLRPKWARYSDYGQNPLLIQEFNFGAE